MSTLTTRNGYRKPEDTDLDVISILTDWPFNLDALDARTAKNNFSGDAAPTANDDSANTNGTGYFAVGSLWLYDHVYYICDSASIGGALWRQFWPCLSANLSGTISDAQLATSYIKANGSRVLSADWDAGINKIKANQFESVIVTGTEPLIVASTTVVANLHAANSDALNALADTAFVKHSLATAANDFLVASGSGAFVKKTLAEAQVILGVGSTGIWQTFPGTPVRVNDTSFTITDTGNANLYNKMFSPGTIISWQKSGGGWQCAKITAATYGSPNVTFTIIGNTLAASFTAMKYCIHRAEREVFIIPGTMPGNTATTDIGKTFYPVCDILIISAQSRYKTGPTTTNGVWDINDDGTTVFTTKLVQTAGQTNGVETVSDCVAATADTVVAAGSLVTLDYDSGHATTPGADAYVEIWYIPESWRYQS